MESKTTNATKQSEKYFCFHLNAQQLLVKGASVVWQKKTWLAGCSAEVGGV